MTFSILKRHPLVQSISMLMVVVVVLQSVMPVFALAALPTAASVTPVADSVRVVMYNAVTGTTPVNGATVLTGSVAYNNTGALKTALSSGNFMGVEDGQMVFKDSSGI
jgi:hypothetical protein